MPPELRLFRFSYFLIIHFLFFCSFSKYPNLNKGGDVAPIPNDGYWVDRSSSDYAALMYKCSRDTCKSTVKNSTCWELSNYNKSECLEMEDELQCSEGAQGEALLFINTSCTLFLPHIDIFGPILRYI